MDCLPGYKYFKAHASIHGNDTLWRRMRVETAYWKKQDSYLKKFNLPLKVKTLKKKELLCLLCKLPELDMRRPGIEPW